MTQEENRALVRTRLKGKGKVKGLDLVCCSQRAACVRACVRVGHKTERDVFVLVSKCTYFVLVVGVPVCFVCTHSCA